MTSRAFLKGALTGAALILFLQWLFPGLGPGGGGGGEDLGHLPTLERLRRTRVARIGFANEAPYAYLDTKTGRLTGEAPEIARVVFRRLGVDRVEGVLTEFGALIPGLKAGRFDVIAAGMYVTPPRCQQVDFSTPTYSVGEGLVVPSGNPKGLHSYRDIAAKGATIGVVTGAIQRRYALESGILSDKIKVFPDAASALEAVGAGRVDGYAATSLTVNDLLARAGDAGLERAEPFADPIIDGAPVRGYGAFVFRPGDDALRAAFDRELDQFIGSPQHLELVAPFGFTEAELPGEVTVAELCQGAPAR
ncbi:MAG TPA: ectoine/hydroxyectoine ABC transporter substrate-binding protein EhuB [Kofleriaceae bacterium]|nr:ectoine/hydroxyectoine ABC transporter substrate-binding protein EhuB [Kofleriaceae bacterium]